jgi:hypothetical protein
MFCIVLHQPSFATQASNSACQLHLFSANVLMKLMDIEHKPINKAFSDPDLGYL